MMFKMEESPCTMLSRQANTSHHSLVDGREFERYEYARPIADSKAELIVILFLLMFYTNHIFILHNHILFEDKVNEIVFLTIKNKPVIITSMT